VHALDGFCRHADDVVERLGPVGPEPILIAPGDGKRGFSRTAFTG
jgi:hypothetical protein